MSKLQMCFPVTYYEAPCVSEVNRLGLGWGKAHIGLQGRCTELIIFTLKSMFCNLNPKNMQVLADPI